MTKTRSGGIGTEIAEHMDFLREINDVKRLYACNLGPNSYTSLVFLGLPKRFTAMNRFKPLCGARQ